jgi:hypothetical protein
VTRGEQLSRWLDLVIGTSITGYLHLVWGTAALGDNGKVVHPDISENQRPVRWPAERDWLEAEILRLSERCDVWTTTWLAENPCRQLWNDKGTKRLRRGLPLRALRVDLDRPGPDALARADELVARGGVIVGSGTGANRHVYVFLTELVPPERLEPLEIDFVYAFGAAGDKSSHASNAILRPAGTLNWKPFALRGEPPAPVTLLRVVDGPGWDEAELRRRLPASPKSLFRPGAFAQGQPEPVPDCLPPDVERSLLDPADVVHRGPASYRLVVRCYESGLSLGQTLSLARLHAPSVTKYDTTGRHDLERQVGGMWAKLVAERGEAGQGPPDPSIVRRRQDLRRHSVRLGRLLASGRLPAPQVVDALLGIGRRLELPDEEVERTVSSALRWGMGHPR